MESADMTQVNYSALVINAPDCHTISSQIPLTLVPTGSAAKTAILDSKRRFAAIFIDPVMPHPGGIELISLAHRHRPATPVYVLYRSEKPFSDRESTRMGIQEQVKTPLTSTIIKERLAPKIFEYWFDRPELPLISIPSQDDRSYLPVVASDFLTGTPSLYDIHVRLPSGRYFKILNALDTLAPDRALSYIEKGVSHFYLRKTSVDRCLSYCDMLAKFLISHAEVSVEMKTSELYNKGHRLVSAIQTDGLTPDHLDFAVTFVAQVRMFLQRMDIEDEKQIRALVANVPLYDRSITTTMIAGLLALPLKVESDQAFRAIGIAALLHDIGLVGLPKERYLEHPDIGARMLEQIDGIDTVSVQAVAQHHERRNNSGFPGRVRGTEINRIAELIGIADEFVSALDEARQDATLDPFKKMEENVFAGFSFPVIESFRTIFMPDPKKKKYSALLQ